MEKELTRESIFLHYERYSEDTKYQIDNLKTKNTLLKSYIFETFNKDMETYQKHELEIPNLFKNKNTIIKQVDESLFALYNQRSFIGTIEVINDRFNFFHTPLPAKLADPVVKSFLKNSRILDSLWISGKIYDSLLNNIINYHSSNRYTKIKFESELLYDDKYFNEDIHLENRASSMTLTDGLENLRGKIHGIRNHLPLFNSITALRLPSKSGAGGHEFYSNGKVTNRSTSFLDHRNQIISVTKSYENLTESIENKCWIELEKIPDSPDKYHSTFKACPVVIEFSTPINITVLERFIELAFKSGSPPFKIVGDIYKINDSQYHVYGTDMHLWQSIFIDISTSNVILYLPYGTCGNTIHRFITNIQKYLSPALNIFVGNDSFEELIKNSFLEV